MKAKRQMFPSLEQYLYHSRSLHDDDVKKFTVHIYENIFPTLKILLRSIFISNYLEDDGVLAVEEEWDRVLRRMELRSTAIQRYFFSFLALQYTGASK